MNIDRLKDVILNKYVKDCNGSYIYTSDILVDTSFTKIATNGDDCIIDMSQTDERWMYFARYADLLCIEYFDVENECIPFSHRYTFESYKFFPFVNAFERNKQSKFNYQKLPINSIDKIYFKYKNDVTDNLFFPKILTTMNGIKIDKDAVLIPFKNLKEYQFFKKVITGINHRMNWIKKCGKFPKVFMTIDNDITKNAFTLDNIKKNEVMSAVAYGDQNTLHIFCKHPLKNHFETFYKCRGNNKTS